MSSPKCNQSFSEVPRSRKNTCMLLEASRINSYYTHTLSSWWYNFPVGTIKANNISMFDSS